jgi:holin (3TMs family)
MGLISRLLGLGRAAKGIGGAFEQVAEVFVPNRTKKQSQEYREFIASMDQFGAEFATPRQGWFDTFVNGLNRLPRPALALGTFGLFVFAMADPTAFSDRMAGLALVPDPLWWLLGAIVSFYFGAREMSYLRGAGARIAQNPAYRRAVTPASVSRSGAVAEDGGSAADSGRDTDSERNAALEEWQGRG